MSDIRLGSAPPETFLDPFDEDARIALEQARQGGRRRVSEVVARWPRFSEAWATLAEICEGDDTVAAYAFARTGYHRGLDALRAAGWRGSGYVRWSHEPNRGFLRCLDALRRLAGTIGEVDEEERCGTFLRQLDPDWERRGGAAGSSPPAGGRKD